MNSNAVAIVGMAGRFPGASNIEELWRNLAAGIDGIRDLTDAELAAAGVDEGTRTQPGYVKTASILEGADLFDAGFFGYSKREAESFDPQQRVFLECCWEALENAGYVPDAAPGLVGVFAGCSPSSYLQSNFARGLDGSVDATLVYIGNDKDSLAIRVSHKLNLKGPSLGVQSYCSTSLVAVHLACQSLLDFHSDMCLAGGISLSFPQGRGLMPAEGGLYSKSGRCRSFDASADGVVFGNGVGVVVLKRLKDALSAGDNIYAIILGSAVNNDGGQKAAFSAPSVEGQAEVVRAALAVADAAPDSIGYVEAHGTGTNIGDPIEVEALTRAFRSKTLRSGFCALGTIKSNIGHLDKAAGVAALIKTALAVKHGKIPPSLHFRIPNPKIDFARSPFFINTRLTSWPSELGPRRAGVSSFGIGGTNAHVVLEEPPPFPSPVGPARAHCLLVLSARSPKALHNARVRLADHLAANPDLSLSDAAFTLQAGRKPFAHRFSLLCSDTIQAIAGLKDETSAHAVSGSSRTASLPLVFLFSEGLIRPGLGRRLYLDEACFREQVDLCARLLLPHLGQDIRLALYPAKQGRDQAEDALALAPWATVALFTVEYALGRQWMAWGARPEASLGEGVGQWVAACLSGELELSEALRLLADPDWREGSPRIQELMRRAEELLRQGPKVLVEMAPGANMLDSMRKGTEGTTRVRAWQQANEKEIEGYGLSAVGQAWVNGAAVDWQALHQGFARRRVPLPSYPFERQRYWMEEKGIPAAGKPRLKENPGTRDYELPALGRSIDMPLEEMVFETEYSAESGSVITDHKIYGKVVVPGAMHLSRLVQLSAHRGLQEAWFRHVSFRKALVLEDGASHRVVLLLSSPESSVSAFRISGKSGEERIGAEWQVHVEGTILAKWPENDPLPSNPSTHAYYPENYKASPGLENFRLEQQGLGLELGDRYQWIEELWADGSEALSRMRLAKPEDRIDIYRLPPGLIDSCFQTLGGCTDLQLSGLDGPAYVPLSLDTFHYHGLPLEGSLWCHARLHESQNYQEVITADIVLLNERRKPIAEFLGLSLKRAPRELLLTHGKEESLEKSLYEIQWTAKAGPEKSVMPSQVPALRRDWVVLGEPGAFVNAMKVAFEKAGNKVWIAPSGSTEPGMGAWNAAQPTRAGYAGLLERVARQAQGREIGILFAHGLDWRVSEETSAEEWQAVNSLIYERALCLLQATAEGEWGKRTAIFLLSHGAFGTGNETDGLTLAASGLPALASVFLSENPGYMVSTVDLDPGQPAESQTAGLLGLVAEPEAGESTAFRGDRRLSPRLVHAERNALRRPVPIVLQPDAAYLITGGAGGLGLAMARWMLSKGAGSVYLAGRTANPKLPPDLIKDARIHAVSADVADRNDLAQALSKIEAAGKPLRGVVHAAGVLNDGIILKKEWGDFERTLRPKWQGAWNLHALTGSAPLDFMVFFSSTSSVMGAVGQCDYAVANSFLDSLARYRTLHGKPALSIGWGPWGEVGMAANMDERLRERQAAVGLGALAVTKGMAAFEGILQGIKPHAFCIEINWQTFSRRQASAWSLPLYALLRKSADVSKPEGSTALENRPHPMKMDKALLTLESVTAFLERKLKERLGIVQTETIDSSMSLLDLGMDSLIAIEFRGDLTSELGISVPIDKFFDNGGIPKLAMEILARVQEPLPVPASSKDFPGESPGMAETRASLAAGTGEKGMAWEHGEI